MNATILGPSRFGLGALGHAAPPAYPRAGLLAELERYQPAPAPIAGLPGSGPIIRDLAAALEERKEQRKEQRQSRRDKAAADSTPEPPAAMPMMQAMPAAPAKPGEAAPSPELKAARAVVRDHYLAAVAARTQVALVSDTPFAERLVHFWANHFAVSVDKLQIIPLAGALEFEAIRPNLMGGFGDMLLAVEQHPAMLLYLDQAQSVGPDSFAGQVAGRRGKRQVGLNENLAREILELHTLGVRTVYTQQDVTEFARALTGWTVAGLKPSKVLPTDRPGHVFAPLIHQPGERLVLGRRYHQAGAEQARAILADLAVHPATARHIATKLARHFAADNPPPALVARLEQAFLTTGGQLPALYRVLVDSPECWTGAKFRNPWDWGVAAMRALDIKTLPAKATSGLFTTLGQQVWKPGSPAGYDDTAAAWAAPDALLRRVEAAGRVGQKAGVIDARALAERLYGTTLSPATRVALAGAESPAQAVALFLVSPEMLRR